MGECEYILGQAPIELASPMNKVIVRWAAPGPCYYRLVCKQGTTNAPVNPSFFFFGRLPHPPPSLSNRSSRHGVANPRPIQGPAPRRRPNPRRRRCRAASRRDPRALFPVPLHGRPVTPWARQGSFVSSPPCLLHISRSELVIVI